MKSDKSRKRFVFLCVAPATILFFIFMILPTLNVFRMSLYERGAYSPNETFVGLKNFQHLLKDTQFIRSMQNMILLVVVVTIVTFAFALVFAAILTREKIKGQNFFRVIFYIPNILSVVVISGIFSAIYLVEYAKRGNRLVKLVRITAETLSGIPSIVYGLFGYVLFVITLHWGYTLLSGAITLAIMILPLIMRTTEEALIAVPDSFREGSFGLGAGRLRTVFRIVLPSAVPGILAGVILAIGRIVGESAALIFTAGTNPVVPDSLFASTRTLSVHMYALMSEGLYTEQAFATAVVLLVVVIFINALSGFVAKRLATDK